MSKPIQKPRIIPIWNNLPAELCALNQWVMWRWEQRKDKEGNLKWTKPPYQPNGYEAKTHDKDNPPKLPLAKDTWSPFDRVKLALANGGNFSGIGPVFSETDPYFGLDCDHCLDAQLQIIDPLVAWIVELLNTYTEVSPSRNGLKLWVLAKKPGKRCSVKANFGEIALYDKWRFFAMTGEVWPPGSPAKPIADRQTQIETIYQRLFSEKTTVKKQPAQTSLLNLNDAQLLDLARKAKDGAKFIALYDRGDVGAYGNDDSRADAALCSLLAFWCGRDAARMDSLFRRSALMRGKWDRDDYRERTIEYAIGQCDEIYTPPPPMPDEPEYVQPLGNTIDDAEGNGPPPPPPPNGPAQGQPQPPGGPRPEIRIALGDAPDVINAAEDILLKHAEELRIFQRLGAVIRVISLCGDELLKQQKRTGLKLPEGQVVLDPLPTIAIVETFERLIHWLRFDRRANKWFSADCPVRYAEKYMARRGSWRLPYLTGVIEAPILLDDGRVLREPGYDHETGLYLATKEDWPAMPQWTSAANAWEDARAAARRLLAPFSEFPFVKPAHRAVFLAAVLTALQRRQLNFAPLMAFSAHMQRTGKSLLAEAVGVLAMGRAPASASVGDGDEDEMRKSFIAILLSGTTILNLDNIVEGRPLDSPDLAKILTQSYFQGRLLGTNQTPELPTNLTVLGTGNNFSVTGDLTMRTLISKLDAGVAHPEERCFQIAHLCAYLREHRVELVTDALTILKAWHYAEKPEQDVKPWGGFDQWSREIREPIVWLGLDELADPCETRGEVAAQDPEREFNREALNQWHSRYSNREMVIKDIVDELRNIDKDDDPEWLSKMKLKSALLNVVGDSRLAYAISARRFGKWCSQIEGRIIDGLRLSRAGIRTHATTWRVTQVL